MQQPVEKEVAELKVNLLSVINTEGEVYSLLTFCNSNQLVLHHFFSLICEKAYELRRRRGKESLLIMDNASYHKTPLIRNCLSKSSLSVLYLPSKSP